MSTTPEFPLFRNEISGISVTDIAAQFGTPTFVYDAETVTARVKDLAAFDAVRYAQKACSNLAVLDLVRRAGGVVDSVSAFEILRALKVGFQNVDDPTPIVYTADVFDALALELCLEHDIHVNCGSPDMIGQYGSVAPGREITLRLNPGFGHGHSQKTNTGGPQSKHGIWHEQLRDCVELAGRYGLIISGLHMHIGSGTDLEHLSKVCGAMENAVMEVGDSITTISAGGGLPICYSEEETPIDLARYYQLWDETRGRLQEKLGHPIRVEIEPGRYIAAESGYLVTEIRAVKRMGENLFYLVDAGFNNLARPILYGAYHPMSICPRDGATSGPVHDVIVGGPLCESGDIFTQEEGGFVSKRSLPEANVGDLLVIERCGAYGSVMGSNYNSKPMAAEVLITDGQGELIRQRQSFDDLIRNERIPG